jgi:hypothetical protein
MGARYLRELPTFTRSMTAPACSRGRAWATAAVLAVAACGGPAENARSATLEEVAVLEPSFQLQENDEVVNVVPLVSVDPRGGFLVADSREAQVRRYGPRGELLWNAGRRGSGPGEFRQPQAAVRMKDGSVAAVDMGGRITIFDSVGSRVVRTVRSPFRFVEDVEVLDDSLLLVSAIFRDQGKGPRLHLWNARADTVVTSFFAPFLRARNPVAATIAGWTKVAVRGDSVAAIFALSDSVHFFDRGGRTLGSVPIPFIGFRRVGAEVPDGGEDPVRREKWLTSFDYVADVHWLPDGDLLIAYQSIVPGGAYTRDWHLTRMSPSGRRVFEARGIPWLLTVDSRDGGLYLVTPGAEVPNQWTLARLRR